MRALIEQVRYRRWQRRNAELFLAANFAVHEIKRRTVRELLDTRRSTRVHTSDDVIDGTVEEPRP